MRKTIHPEMGTAFLAAALSALSGLSGCSRNPASGDSDRVSDLPGAYDTASTGPMVAAWQAHEDGHERHRLLAAEDGEDTTVYGQLIATPTLALLPGGSPAASGARQAPILAAALLKRAQGPAAATPWGNTGDTTGYRYDDSARGYIQQVRQAVRTDSLGTAQVSDSLVYRWPHSPSSPAVLAHVQRRTYAGGLDGLLQVFDEDGDGILNEAAAGKVVKLRKEWTLRSADTAWKTVAWTTHGQTTWYDSLGAGSLSTWTDSAFVAGKPAWWQRLYDGDGDGLVLAAAAGVRVKVLRDAFAANPDGSIRLDYEGYLAGPDGDYLQSADNERLPFRSVVIDAEGKDRMRTVFGDADGDGHWWSPAAGAGNRGWVVNAYSPSDSLAAFKDSTVLLVPASPAAAPRLLSYAAEARRVDGRVTAYATRLAGAALPDGSEPAFSGGDTVQFRERTSYAAYAAPAGHPAADWDSTVRVGWLIPGDFGSTADDKLVQWYSETHFKAGRARSRTAELLKADRPFAPGTAPASGTYIREEHFRPLSGKSLVSVAETRAFGPDSPERPWKRVRRFENGDSSVAIGRLLPGGGMAYAQALGSRQQVSGRRDATTGAFQDTVTWLDAKGVAVARDVTAGTLDRRAGTGEYRRRRSAPGSGRTADTAEVRYLLTREGRARGFLRIAGGDTLAMAVDGDTVHCLRDLGDLRLTMRWHPSADGSFALRQAVGRPAQDEEISLADYVFGADGAGAGVHERYLAGGATREGKVEFRADGSIFYDGIRVVPGR